MKKIKLSIVLVLIGIITFSCSKDDGESIETVQETQVLAFDSKQAIEDEIERVLELKKEKEAVIITKIYGENGIPSLTKEMIAKGSSSQVSKKDLFESVKLYHQERLKAIYEEREERNFTSIQSIADEINSLKVLNGSKSESLYSKHESLLEKSKFSSTPIFDYRISNLINTQGEISLKGKKIKLNENQTAQKGDKDGIKKEGLLGTSPDDLLAVTWHAGIRINQNIASGFIDGDMAYCQFATYVLYQNQYVPFLGAFAAYPDSGASFGNPLAGLEYDENNLPVRTGCDPISLRFPSGSGAAIVRNTEYFKKKCTYSFNDESFLFGKASGVFAIIVGVQPILVDLPAGVTF